jgi:MTH538 TIR-like domain (DUF1863)
MAYKVFICHAYDHQGIYDDLRQKLNDRRPKFEWRNLSVQYDMRYGTVENEIDQAELRALIGKRIEDCEIVLALTKPIASRREWLQWEISRAKELGKPVIGIARKKNDNVSSFVRKHADDIVDTWRVDHIINAIETYVGEYRLKKPAAGLVPSALPPLPVNAPDDEVTAQPTPEAPLELLTTQPTGQGALPRDVLFPDRLGSYIPGSMTVRDNKQPRWWWPFKQNHG